MGRSGDHSDKPKQHGNKTHEQFLRTVERKDDLPKPGEPHTAIEARDPATHPPHHPGARQSEFPVSRGGIHQESQHDKHHDAEKGAPKHNGGR